MREQSVNFDRAADFYDATRGFPPEIDAQVAEFIRTTGNLQPSDRVLEIGVGTGRIALPVAPHIREYVGVDISEAMLIRLLEKQPTKSIYVALADAEMLPFPTDSFDVIIIVHVLHLVRDPKPVADELARVLNPTGTVLNCVGGHDDSLKPIQDVWTNATADYRAKRPVFNSIDILPNLGWEQIGDVHTMEYPFIQTPAHFLEMVQSRAWSSTWDMTDNDLNHAIMQVKQVIHDHYDDNPNQQVHGKRTFNIHRHTPPR